MHGTEPHRRVQTGRSRSEERRAGRTEAECRMHWMEEEEGRLWMEAVGMGSESRRPAAAPRRPAAGPGSLPGCRWTECLRCNYKPEREEKVIRGFTDQFFHYKLNRHRTASTRQHMNPHHSATTHGCSYKELCRYLCGAEAACWLYAE